MRIFNETRILFDFSCVRTPPALKIPCTQRNLVRVIRYLNSQSLVLNSYFGYTFQLLRFLGPTNASLIFYLLPYRWKSMGHIPKVIKSSRCKGRGWERSLSLSLLSLSLSSISGVPQLVSPSVLVLIEIRFRYKARFRMASSSGEVQASRLIRRRSTYMSHVASGQLGWVLRQC